MPKVVCPCIECKYNKHHRCKANYLRFAFQDVATIRGSRINAWECDMYELSDRAKLLEECAAKLAKDHLKDNNHYNRKD